MREFFFIWGKKGYAAGFLSTFLSQNKSQCQGITIPNPLPRDMAVNKILKTIEELLTQRYLTLYNTLDNTGWSITCAPAPSAPNWKSLGLNDGHSLEYNR